VSVAPARPLAGRRILVTRAEEKGGRFARLLQEQGAEVLQIPLIRFEDPDSWEPLREALSQVQRFHRILFTSATAVDRFFERLRAFAGDSKLPAALSVAAVGPGTAQALARWGHAAQLAARSFRAEGLLEMLPTQQISGQEVLFPRAQEARELLVEELTRRGARVALVPVYKTVPREESRGTLRTALNSGRIDVATFTAASTVHHFADFLGEADLPRLMRQVRVACLGQVTAEAARERGLHPDIVAERSTLENLAAAITEHFQPGSQKP